MGYLQVGTVTKKGKTPSSSSPVKISPHPLPRCKQSASPLLSYLQGLPCSAIHTHCLRADSLSSAVCPLLPAIWSINFNLLRSASGEVSHLRCHQLPPNHRPTFEALISSTDTIFRGHKYSLFSQTCKVWGWF